MPPDETFALAALARIEASWVGRLLLQTAGVSFGVQSNQPAATRSSLTPQPRNRIAVPALMTVLVAFVALVVFIVGATLRTPEAPMFEPTPVALAPRPFPDTAVMDTITIDARDPDRWVFFDFARNSAVYPPDTTGWDLAFRRFKTIASGTVADLGPTPFEAAADTSATAHVSTTIGRDTVNTAIDRWYRYGFMTHLLTPKVNVYATRNRDDTRAKLQFLGYYCPGMQAGCVTFRYETMTNDQ